MRVLVTGGRNYSDFKRISEVLRELKPKCVIHGNANGADKLAGKWAELYGISVESYPANWELHGKAAGPIRNGAMLKFGKPDLVVAFPGGAGTFNMVKQATKAGVEVRRIDH